MQREDIKNLVRLILVKVLKHENFEMNDAVTATEVDGWDSLTHMVIISEIEEKLNIQFKLKELNKLRNMGTLIDLIESKVSVE
ncbi:MAG: acyl carrier protein [Flavobacteriales bacterium]|jgi:acyl carrier protein